MECPCKDVRLTFAHILVCLMRSYLTEHGGVPTNKCLEEVLECLLYMLHKEVIDQCKHSVQYFYVLMSYVKTGTKACTHMFLRNGFKRLAIFLLGINGAQQETSSRRWSSIQSREFGHLHTTLAMLILNCDVSKYRTIERDEYVERKPHTVTPKTFLKMSMDMERYVYGNESTRYLREVVHAIREVGYLESVCDMLLYCSFCNETFSTTLLKQLMLQYMTASANELKPVFTLLTDLLVLEDPLQLKRLQLVIDGHVDDNGTQFEGLLAVVRLNHTQDSRRSYSCIKFLVNLANRCPLVKDYLQQTKSKWQWAVNWLKKKMSEYTYWSNTTTLTSNEDSNRKSFQRTVSAQDTLAEATALLTELENCPDMDTNGNPVVTGDGDTTSTQGEDPTPGQSTDTHMSSIEEEKKDSEKT